MGYGVERDSRNVGRSMKLSVACMIGLDQCPTTPPNFNVLYALIQCALDMLLSLHYFSQKSNFYYNNLFSQSISKLNEKSLFQKGSFLLIAFIPQNFFSNWLSCISRSDVKMAPISFLGFSQVRSRSIKNMCCSCTYTFSLHIVICHQMINIDIANEDQYQ